MLNCINIPVCAWYRTKCLHWKLLKNIESQVTNQCWLFMLVYSSNAFSILAYTLNAVLKPWHSSGRTKRLYCGIWLEYIKCCAIWFGYTCFGNIKLGNLCHFVNIATIWSGVLCLYANSHFTFLTSYWLIYCGCALEFNEFWKTWFLRGLHI